MSQDLTSGNPLKLIISFTIPILIGNLFQQGYNIVDLLIVGRFNGVDALAAVGSTGSLMFLVIGWIVGMTSGFAILIAQSYGAGDYKLLRHYMYVTNIICGCMIVILTVTLLIFNKSILRLMNTPDNIFEDASTFIGIIYAGLVTTVMYNMLSSTLRAIGDSRTPLYFLLGSSLLNIVLDLLFVGGFDMGVAGAGYATVISQGVAAILCYVYMQRKYEILRLHKEDRVYSGRSAIRLLFMGIPMALQFSITAIGTMIVQTALNGLGSVYIAAFSTSSKIQNIMTLPFSCTGITMATYVGQNVGAGKIDRIKTGVKKAITLVLAISVVSATIVMMLGDKMAGTFISGVTPQVLEVAKEYFHTIAWFYPFLCLIYIYRNALQGLGDGVVPMIGGIFELVARGGIIFAVAGTMGFAGICLADPGAWVSALIPLIPVYYYRINRMKVSSSQTMKDENYLTLEGCK